MYNVLKIEKFSKAAIAEGRINGVDITVPKIIATFQLGGLSTRSQNEIVRDFRKISFDIYGYFWGNKIIDAFIWKINQFVRSLYSFILKRYK